MASEDDTAPAIGDNIDAHEAVGTEASPPENTNEAEEDANISMTDEVNIQNDNDTHEQPAEDNIQDNEPSTTAADSQLDPEIPVQEKSHAALSDEASVSLNENDNDDGTDDIDLNAAEPEGNSSENPSTMAMEELAGDVVLPEPEESSHSEPPVDEASPSLAMSAAGPVSPRRAGHQREDSVGVNDIEVDTLQTTPTRALPVEAPDDMSAVPGCVDDIEQESAPNTERHYSLTETEPHATQPTSHTCQWPMPAEVKAQLADLQEASLKALITPKMIHSTMMTDRIAELAQQHGVESLRRHTASQLGGPPQLPTITPLAMEAEEQLQELHGLVKDGSYGMALHKTYQFINAHGDGCPSPGYLQVWLVRSTLMLKFKLFDQLAQELDSFGSWDRADLWYEAYPTTFPSLSGSIVPFSLRLIHAQLPSYIHRQRLAMDRLCVLKSVCEKTIKQLNEMDTSSDVARAIAVWQHRRTHVLCSLSNCLLILQDYSNAAAMYESAWKYEFNPVAIYSGLGRIALAQGHIRLASKRFAQATDAAETSEDLQVLMNTALLALAREHPEDAINALQRLLQADASNTAAVNNLGVAHLYKGELRKAIDVLENKLPDLSGLSSDALFNLSTCYELETNKSSFKKRAWIPFVMERGHDDFDISTLKL
eukprot:TRINITY_DN9169_c0_g1_i2.p1 TRINITY_DN9169_c0_g1~~TRINITY_DN9169_c0_g1_i2.p1  ORF type:complete len:654 (+),score=154.20 TRINITY_DN9169_c0_g1_i2:1-1962(+)